jgi:hypothetical protein
MGKHKANLLSNEELFEAGALLHLPRKKWLYNSKITKIEDDPSACLAKHRPNKP